MWTGRFLYGKCDVVHGEFYVATEFQHVAWLPIIPIRTWVVLEGSLETTGDDTQSFDITWEGSPIPFSFKSFLVAWARTLLILAAICTCVYALLLLLVIVSQPAAWTRIVIPLLWTALFVAVYWLSFRVTAASRERQAILREVVNRKYGQA